MRYAVIDNATGVVINIILLESGSNWNPPTGTFIIASDTSGIGWSWNGTSFLNPPMYVVRDVSHNIIASFTAIMPGYAEEKIAVDNPELIAFNSSVIAAANAEAVRDATILADSLRVEMITQLKTATSTQIETYVRTKLNADAVTNLATAVTFCKRVETAFVQVAKVLALNIRDDT